MTKSAKDEIVLTYRDNGPGLPPDFDFNDPKSIGLMLIRLSVQQINGKYSIDGKKGFQFEMTINPFFS